MSTPTRIPTRGDYESAGAPGPRPRRGPSHRRSRKRRTREQIIRRRRIAVLVLAVVLLFVSWVGVSLGQALTNPALGSSVGARLAEWFREHGGAPIVNWAENVWYSVSVMPLVVFSVAIIVGINASISCVAEAVRWMSAVRTWNFSASWSIPSNESNRDRNDEHMGMS